MRNNTFRLEKNIFKKGSKTYYNSSLFFPKEQKQDILRLYSFVRIVDDCIDNKPQQAKRFNNLVKAYKTKKLIPALSETDKIILNNIFYLENKYKFDKEWIEAFIKSMQMDLKKRKYISLNDTLEYTYGSAEVIGLMMAKIIGLKSESLGYAALQGRAMQYINFIRDINEDIRLNRCYFALNVRQKYGLATWNSTINNQKQFDTFVRGEIDRYVGWQNEAAKGWKYIPYRSRIAIKTAAKMYKWTAMQIYKNPSVVFEKKVKPSKLRVLLTGLYSAL